MKTIRKLPTVQWYIGETAYFWLLPGLAISWSSGLHAWAFFDAVCEVTVDSNVHGGQTSTPYTKICEKVVGELGEPISLSAQTILANTANRDKPSRVYCGGLRALPAILADAVQLRTKFGGACERASENSDRFRP